MTVLQRRRLRAAVLEHFLSQAAGKAGTWKLSPACVQAMAVMNRDPAGAAGLHASCKAEEPGGPGCLCPCHDAREGGVVTGSSVA